jgi:hypothetical protein
MVPYGMPMGVYGLPIWPSYMAFLCPTPLNPLDYKVTKSDKSYTLTMQDIGQCTSDSHGKASDMLEIAKGPIIRRPPFFDEIYPLPIPAHPYQPTNRSFQRFKLISCFFLFSAPAD